MHHLKQSRKALRFSLITAEMKALKATIKNRTQGFFFTLPK